MRLVLNNYVICQNCFIFLILLLQFDEGRNDYDGEFDLEKINKFISANSLPLVTEFNDEVKTMVWSIANRCHFQCTIPSLPGHW